MYEYDWLLVVDDDVVLPERFLDRFLGVAGRFELEPDPPVTLADQCADPKLLTAPANPPQHPLSTGAISSKLLLPAQFFQRGLESRDRWSRKLATSWG